MLGSNINAMALFAIVALAAIPIGIGLDNMNWNGYHDNGNNDKNCGQIAAGMANKMEGQMNNADCDYSNPNSIHCSRGKDLTIRKQVLDQTCTVYSMSEIFGGNNNEHSTFITTCNDGRGRIEIDIWNERIEKSVVNIICNNYN